MKKCSSYSKNSQKINSHVPPRRGGGGGGKVHTRNKAHCSSKYERATFAQASRRSLNLSSARAFQNNRSLKVYTPRDKYLAAPLVVERAEANPLWLPPGPSFRFCPGARGNFVATNRSILDKGEASVCKACPRSRPQRDHQLACMHVNVAPPNLQPIFRDRPLPTESWIIGREKRHRNSTTVVFLFREKLGNLIYILVGTIFENFVNFWIIVIECKIIRRSLQLL